jgi:hypothetical protein
MEITSLALDECIRTYEREIARKSSLESKASSLLSTSAIVVSILNGFIAFIVDGTVTFNNFGVLILLNIVATILIGISIYWTLKILRIKKHFIPFDVKNPNLLKKKLDKKEEDLTKELINRYLAIIPQIHNFNNTKATLIERSWKVLIIGLFISILGLIITICAKGGL